MWTINSVLNSFFDLLINPFRGVHPLWYLFFFSLLTGILMLLIFRYTSNQKKIKETKDKIKAYLLEIRIFNEDLSILLSAQKHLLFYNAKYLMHALRPLLFMMVPVLIILIQLQGWFGHRPLGIGESTLLKVKFTDEGKKVLSNVSTAVDKGIVIETPPLRNPEEAEVDWRIRAKEMGEHTIIIKIQDYSFQKNVVISDKRLARVSPNVVGSSLLEIIFNPGEKPIPQNPLIKRIEVGYPSRSLEILGWRIHWLVLFFVFSIISGFAFRGVFGVEL